MIIQTPEKNLLMRIANGFRASRGIRKNLDGEALVELANQKVESKPEQEKTVEITTNGTTEIAADEGKALSKVVAVVNVPISTTSKLPQVVTRTVTEITAEDLAGATHIGVYAFYWCERLTSVAIPNSVTSIGNDAFSGCYNLSSVSIGNSVTSIGAYAFAGCSSLTSITIPNSVTDIGNYAFTQSDSITNAYYDGDIVSWCNISFGDERANPVHYAKKLYIKNSETNEYELLTNLVIPDSVTEIKPYAFHSCESLTSIDIPDSVTSIGSNTFSRCNGLKNIDIPNGVLKIDVSAFNSCKGLESVIISNTVTHIASYAFNNCTNLKTVRIGSGILTIESSSSFNTSSLTDIYIDAEEDSVPGAPWGATNATIHWNTPLPTEEA